MKKILDAWCDNNKRLKLWNILELGFWTTNAKLENAFYEIRSALTLFPLAP